MDGWNPGIIVSFWEFTYFQVRTVSCTECRSNVYTSKKLTCISKNDVLEKVTPFEHGKFWYLCSISPFSILKSHGFDFPILVFLNPAKGVLRGKGQQGASS